MIINVSEQYNFNDFSDKSLVFDLCEKIDINTDDNLVLNLERCIPDYQSTAILIDYILENITTIEKQVDFTITIDLRLPKHQLMSFLFGGSNVLNIKPRSSKQEMEEIIDNYLSTKNLSLTIIIKDNRQKELQRYEF